MLRLVRRVGLHEQGHLGERVALLVLGTDLPRRRVVRIERELRQPQLRNPVLLDDRVLDLECVRDVLLAALGGVLEHQLQAARVHPGNFFVLSLF